MRKSEQGEMKTAMLQLEMQKSEEDYQREMAEIRSRLEKNGAVFNAETVFEEEQG
jgi:hypothetical protein